MKAQPSTSREHPFEVKDGVAYADLLTRAHSEGLKSIATEVILQPSDANGRLCIIKAAVETGKGRFEAVGDADPSSVEERFLPHLIRVAETRAKARALRDAVNCGVVSLEELDGAGADRSPASPGPGVSPPRRTAPRSGNGAAPRGASRPPRNGNGEDGPMTDAQRRYLFRLLAGMGHQGKSAEDYLHAELDIRNLSQVTRSQASGLIDRLLQSSPQNGGGVRGAAHPQR